MKKNPERYILAGALAILILAGAGLTYFFPSFTDIQQSAGTGKTNPVLIKSDELQTAIAPWNNLPTWDEPANKHNMFISEPYLFYSNLYPEGNYLQKDNGDATTSGGVLISWYRKYKINFLDPNVDYEDPDGDGFSNKIEFLNEAARADVLDGSHSTDPTDPKSHPTYISRLRLTKYEPRPFLVEFRGYQEMQGVMNFQIYMKDLPSYLQPKFKKTGDDLGYEGYKIGKFTQIMGKRKLPDGTLLDEDQSTLELIKADIGTTLTLVFRKEVAAPESTAVFVMLMPGENGKELRVPRGKTFVIAPYEPDVTYLVLDVSETQAKIRNIKTKQEYTIIKLDPAEWDDVPQPSTGAPLSPKQ